MSDMPYNLVGVSLQTKYTTKERTEVRSFAISETIMSYLPVTAPFSALILPYFRPIFNSCSFLEYMILRIAGGAHESNY